MAEERSEDKSLLEKFMQKGKVTVFESGLDRPDYIQDRPFFNLLSRGQTSFIEKGSSLNTLKVSSAEEKSEALDTEAHRFFVNMEERFRTVAPGITLFIIDPDAVQGRYLLDESPNRSLGKSLYMHIEEKLRRADADKQKTFLEQDEIVKMVGKAAITDRSPFSMAASVSPTYDALEGIGRVNLIVGDNPDSMSANILEEVVGSNERMEKEGITPDQMRRLCLYHELGHATDEEYTGYSFDKITQNELSDVMRRHRTECIADAHATLQLARDFGNTKAAALWGDMRIEYLRMCVDRRLEDTKYETDFMKKYREAVEKSTSVQPGDPSYETKYKKLMANSEVAGIVQKLGSPLAYHTTDVVDAAIEYAQKHLKDGSLQKMTDLEVIRESKRLAEEHGLSRQQMAEISMALAENKPHPKYKEMMKRCEESRSHMPMERAEIEQEYELRRELNGYIKAANMAGNLGLPAPEQNFSPALQAKLMTNQMVSQQMKVMQQVSLMEYQDALFETLQDYGFSRGDMHMLISSEKETLRRSGLSTSEDKDVFAGSKLKLLDAVIEQAPDVQTSLNANKIVKEKIAALPSDTAVSGDAAIAHFLKHELRSLTAMKSVLVKAINRSPEAMTVEDQIEALRSERKDFTKAMISEKETQIAAFAIRSDKETWAKVASDPVLSTLIDSKAKQKPAVWFAQYQMTAGMPDKGTTAALLQGVAQQHQYVARTVVENPEMVPIVERLDKRLMGSLKKYVDRVKKEEAKETVALSPMNLKQAWMNKSR
jgi:urease accessory protein UreF